MSDISKKGSNKAFDKEALNKLVGNKKSVPTQELTGNKVSEVEKRTTLQIPEKLYIDLKRDYLLKHGLTFKEFVVLKMKEALSE